MLHPKRVVGAIGGHNLVSVTLTNMQKLRLVLAAVLGRHKQDHQRDADEYGQFALPLRLYHLRGSTPGMHAMIGLIIPLCHMHCKK